MNVAVRKITVTIEETFHEGGPAPEHPLAVGVASAVVENPFAGRYEPNLLEFMASLRELGRTLATRLQGALEPFGPIEAYGKAALVGDDGELEHGALWHEAGGWAMRDVLGGCKAIVPGVKSIGALGTRLMIPLGHTEAAYVRSHFGVAELAVWDAPRRGEIVYALAMSTGGRIHARIGGLAASDIIGEDGLR